MFFYLVNIIVGEFVFYFATNLKKLWFILLYAQPFFYGIYLLIKYYGIEN